jgi:hypothetical protein
LTQINNILFETNKKFPEFTSVVDIAKEYGPGKTHENRPIYAIKISGKETQDPKEKPSILILSAHHCREIVTPEIGKEISPIDHHRIVCSQNIDRRLQKRSKNYKNCQ